jgi:protein SCO1/2
VLDSRMKLSHQITTHHKIIKLAASLLLFLVAMNVSADNLPFYNSKEFTPHWIEPNSAELENFHQIPTFSFTDQDGEKFTEKRFENKMYVAGFFFSTCPGICPMIRSKLAKVQDSFLDDPDVEILQHSIRPTTDTVEVLKNYADEHDIKSDKWHLVTGDKGTIYNLAKFSYFASEDLGNIQKTDDFLHTENILLIDQNRHIRGIYNGLNSASMAYLIADIKTLKIEFAEPQ